MNRARAVSTLGARYQVWGIGTRSDILSPEVEQTFHE